MAGSDLNICKVIYLRLPVLERWSAQPMEVLVLITLVPGIGTWLPYSAKG